MFPFEELVYGKSFTVPISSIDELELIKVIAEATARLGKTFNYVKHDELGLYEVGILPTFIAYSVVDSSPEMAKIARTSNRPFDTLQIGQSFTLPIVGTNEGSLRTQCSTQSKKLGMKFKCIKHIELGILEIGRIE